MKLTFLGLPDHPKARVALLPIPLELTTTWLKGTKEGPLEILKVSPNLEFFDEETGLTPQETLGFFTFPLEEFPLDLTQALQKVESLTLKALEKRLFPILLGGEHTLTLGAVRALKRFYPALRVLHLDAHLDFRKEYLGKELNHATILRKIYEEKLSTLSVGIRAVSQEEYEEARDLGLPVIYAYELKRDLEAALKKIEDFVAKGPVYLTLDMDVLDPSLAPGVGTPEPGGLNWWELCEILKRVAKSQVVGLDLVETRPLPFLPHTEFIAAKIIYKFTSYLAKFNHDFKA